MKTWFVTSGDMKNVRARTHDPMAAFLVAVILSGVPKHLGLIAEVVEEGFEGDDSHTYIVATDILTGEIQRSGPY